MEPEDGESREQSSQLNPVKGQSPQEPSQELGEGIVSSTALSRAEEQGQASRPGDPSSGSRAEPASFLQLRWLPLRLLPRFTLCHGYPDQLVQVG